VRNLFYVLLALSGLTSIAAGQQYVMPYASYPGSYQVAPGFNGYSSAQPGYVVPAYPPAAYAPQAANMQAAYAQPVYAPVYAPPGAEMPGVYESAPEFGGAAPCASGNCGHCCPSHCSTGHCLHRSGGFGEFLYWKASGAETSFAVVQNGIGPVGTVPLGQVGVLDYDYEPSFRAGFTLALNCESSLTAAVTKFETRTNNNVDSTAPLVVQPLVMIPGTFNAGFTAQTARADSSLELDIIDLEYRAVLVSCATHHLNFMVGARYAELDQSLGAVFPFAPPDGTSIVISELDFEGLGLRVGLDGERRLFPRLGISVYGKLTGTVLGGEFSGSYTQFNQFNGWEAFTTWSDDRLVPTADGELGLRWSNRTGRIRLSAGYYIGIWGNVVTTSEWINGVQAFNYVDIGRDEHDTLRFDGLVARAEIRI
jgi:hypothetical protein